MYFYCFPNSEDVNKNGQSQACPFPLSKSQSKVFLLTYSQRSFIQYIYVVFEFFNSNCIKRI